MKQTTPEPAVARCPLGGSTNTAGIEFDIYDHHVQDDPYPAYAQMRDDAPLFHQAEHDYYVLNRHEDVHWAFRSDDVFSNAMGVAIDASAWNKDAHRVMSFLGMDPPDQVRLRRLVSKGFTPKRVRELEPRLVELSTHYLDAALGQGAAPVTFDWIAGLAGRLPMEIISDMMGVPHSDRDRVRELSDDLVKRVDGLRDVPTAGMLAALQLFEYYGQMLADRRANPSDDLTTALYLAEDEGQRMTDEEITAFLFLMVVAGNETTTKLLGNALFHLGSNPEQKAAVLSDPESPLIETWIEETLRMDTSSQFLGREVKQEFTRGEVTCPVGAKLLINLGAANHDASVFTDPERFDLGRDEAELKQSVSFGGGRHFCLGANLARLEAKVVLREFVRRVADFDLAPGAERFYSANVRGFAQLPITVTPRVPTSPTAKATDPGVSR